MLGLICTCELFPLIYKKILKYIFFIMLNGCTCISAVGATLAHLRWRHVLNCIIYARNPIEDKIVNYQMERK